VIVVGLGAMGSAACFQLAARGVTVTGIDRHHPPHHYGSTHGDTRVTRLALGEGPEYVPLVRRSHELWREIERETGATLLTQTGGLVLGPPDGPFLRQTRSVARKFGIAHETLDAAELRARFPMFTGDERTEAYFEPQAGYVRPESAVTVQLELARRHGAALALGEVVQDWAASSRGVTVRTDRDRYAAGALVLCAGAWIRQLYPEGGAIFAIYRQLLYWFPIREGYEQLRDMPIFVWDFGADDSFAHLNGLYGFPAIDGPGGGVKVASESYGTTVEPDGRQHPATSAESEAMYSTYVAPRVPWLGAEHLRSVSCLYTTTPGNRFVIDHHPAHDRVLIVSPCSGHGFKHSPAIGESVAQWVTEGASAIDLTPFAFER
jgi:sarcosine oxidase